MPLFATCTIANAILALCAPPGARTFSSWLLAQSLCASIRWPAPSWRAGFPAVAAARCAACLSPGALRACWPATPQIWRFRSAARVAAQLRQRSATATVCRRIWLATCAKLSMRTTAMDLTRHWRPGMAQRTRRVDSTVLAAPDLFCRACLDFLDDFLGETQL